jgi:aspartate ammonia-lyase
VDRERARALVSGSLIEATTLSPYLGYDVVAYLVKEALGSARPLRDVVAGHALLDAPTLARLLRPAMLTRPTVIDTALRRRVQSSRAYRTLKATMQRGARGTRA